ncbi:MAG: PKD domain-containing protein [Thermoplasmatales archaeon]|nr:MAG: PKD domain-containing protein [Thermoplasmatales archaeon]
MDKKLAIVIIVGCLLIIVNMGLAGVPSEETAEGLFMFHLYPDADQSYTTEKDASSHQEEISTEKEIKESITHVSHADAGGPYSGQTDVEIQFDGSNSYVASSGMISYEWDFGDGNKGYSKNPTHCYSTPDVYYAILTIAKNNGETYQDIAPVYIDQEGDHLIPYGGCFYDGKKDEPIVFDGSQSISNDPDAELTEWVWHFGDGAIEYGEKVTHSYSEEKVYLVTLEVKDNNGYKRQDVLHADIGVYYSSIEDFFITSNTELKSVLDVLLTKIGSFILYPLLSVKIYTNFNGYEQTIPLSSGYMLPLAIDVNHDGEDDVVVNNLGFFKPVISKSPFNDKPWFAFETTISDIEKISENITTEDDFTVCLQFSLQIIEDFLDLKEPVVRIGYHSAGGEEKPAIFSATHIFRPFILYRLLGSGSVPRSLTTNNYQMHSEGTSMQNDASRLELPFMQVGEATKHVTTTKEGTTSSSVTQEESNEQQYQPDNNVANGLNIITENGIRVESSDVNNFSLLISFSNDLDTVRTTLKLTFESFATTTLMHRRGETCRDIDFQGTHDAAVTISITRENQHGSATLGMLIEPMQSFGFKIDIEKLANSGRHITFNIENPPENLVLFAESQDTQDAQDSLYFYLKNLPSAIDFEWLPYLANGYITLTKEFATDELEVGVCDDLENPYTNVYMTNLPTKTSLSWDISSTLPRTIELTSDTDGLTLNAELKDVTQENQTIDFHATSYEDFDIKFLWSLPDGYFELQRSTKNIDLDFSLSQDNLRLDVNGSYVGGADDGFTFNFNDFTQGSIEFQSDKSLDLTIDAENYETETSLYTDLAFITGGDIKLEWDESINANVNGNASLGLYDFVLSSPNGNIDAEEITLEGTCHFGLKIEQNTLLQLSGSGKVTFSQLEGEIGYWSSSINSADAGGSFDILLQPKNKYYELDSSHSLDVSGFDIEYDGTGKEYDLDFEIDSFALYSGGTTWFDFSTDSPAFNLDGEDVIDVSNLHLAIGSGSSNVINFTITDAHIDKKGKVYGEWNDEYLHINAAVDFNWDLAISTLNFGDWETHGSIEGSASIDAEWEAGSGNITFDIGKSGFAHDLEITHDDLTLNLGTFSLEPGDITLDWQREDSPTNGHFHILNDGISGNLTLCKIIYDNPQNPLELELGNITLESGNMYMTWSRKTDQKFIHIDNGITIDMALVKVTWNDKILSLEDLILSPGEFNFTWNTVDKQITINNGIEDLGPSLSYEDENLKLSVSLINLQDDYSKTMTLKWYEDEDGNASGLYLDTDGVNMIDWIEFEFIKYDPLGDTGRRIALGGLQANNFKIWKNSNNNLGVNGRLYICNHLTYSKLVNGDWKDLEIQWDLDLDGIGNIEFNADSEFNIKLEISSMFSGININTTFNLPNHLNISWDVDFDGEGYVGLDTNNESIFEIDFRIYKDTQQYHPKWGLYLHCTSVAAEDYLISWNFSKPPGQWMLIKTGYIEPGSIDDWHLAWNGKWYNIMAGGTPV